MAADFCVHPPGDLAFSRAHLPVFLPGNLQAMEWSPCQSEVLAIGGGMKDRCLRVLDVNTGKSIQTPSTHSQESFVFIPHLESYENNL